MRSKATVSGVGLRLVYYSRFLSGFLIVCLIALLNGPAAARAAQVIFGNPSLPDDWFTTPWSAGGSVNVSGGTLIVDGARTGTNTLYGSGCSLEFVGNFSGDAWQHVGFGIDYNAGPWIIFSTFQGGQLYARTNTGSGQTIDTPLSGAWLGAPHRYRIDWNPASIVFSIDGSVIATHPLTVNANLRPLISDLNVGGGNVTLSSIAMSTPILNADLSGTSLPLGWTSELWSDAGLVTVADGLLTLDGARVGPDVLFSAGESLEFVGTFSGDPWQHIGFGIDYSSAPWVIFSTFGGGQLYARTSDDSGNALDEPLAGNWLGGSHDFRIDWSPTNASFSIDGTKVAGLATTITASLRPLISDFNAGGGNLTVSSFDLSNSVFRIGFAQSSLPNGWFTGAYSSTGSAEIANAGLTVDGAQAGTYEVYGPGESVEFVATLSGDAWQHLGFGVDYSSGPWIIFSSYQGGQLYARTRTESGDTNDIPVPGNWFGASHLFRIDWNTGNVVFSIDGSVVANAPAAITTGLRPLISDLSSGGGAVNVQSVSLTP
jgi:Glycosyl hydrolases family 16